MKLTNDQIEASINNSSVLMDDEFNFSPQKILNKKSIFAISIIDEGTIMDKIIEDLNDAYVQNVKYWVEHELGSNFFMLRSEDGRQKILKRARNFVKLKTDSVSVLFSEELLDDRLLKKLKKIKV